MRGKRAVVLSSLFALSVFAGGAVYAELQTGDYTPATLGSIEQSAPRKLSANSTYQINSFPTYSPDLEPGDGMEETKSYCNTCHSPRYIPMQAPLPAATWEAEFNKMIKTYGASIPDDSSQKIIRYLQAHYTPETRKR